MERSDPPEPSPRRGLANSGLIRSVWPSRNGIAGRTGIDQSRQTSPRVTVSFDADCATDQSRLTKRCPSCPDERAGREDRLEPDGAPS